MLTDDLSIQIGLMDTNYWRQVILRWAVEYEHSRPDCRGPILRNLAWQCHRTEIESKRRHYRVLTLMAERQN